MELLNSRFKKLILGSMEQNNDRFNATISNISTNCVNFNKNINGDSLMCSQNILLKNYYYIIARV